MTECCFNNSPKHTSSVIIGELFVLKCCFRRTLYIRLYLLFDYRALYSECVTSCCTLGIIIGDSEHFTFKADARGVCSESQFEAGGR